VEKTCLESLTSFIKREGLEEQVDFVPLRTYDAYMTEEAWVEGKAILQRLVDDGGEHSDIEVHEGLDAKKVSHSSNATALDD
jgi:hypothetical protein